MKIKILKFISEVGRSVLLSALALYRLSLSLSLSRIEKKEFDPLLFKIRLFKLSIKRVFCMSKTNLCCCFKQ